MTLLSRKADYALLILSHLHRAKDGGNARAIAERFGLSRPFVANILKELCHKGYVASHRGVKGGYALKESARAVTLADFLASIDEGFRLTLCNHTADPSDVCVLEPGCPGPPARRSSSPAAPPRRPTSPSRAPRPCTRRRATTSSPRRPSTRPPSTPASGWSATATR